MTQRNTIGSMIALSLAAALAGAGCMAQGADDEGAREPEAATLAANEATEASAASENTAESAQAFFTLNPFDHLLFGHFFFDRAPYFGPFGFLGAACSCSGFGGCW